MPAVTCRKVVGPVACESPAACVRQLGAAAETNPGAESDLASGVEDQRSAPADWSGARPLGHVFDAAARRASHCAGSAQWSPDLADRAGRAAPPALDRSADPTRVAASHAPPAGLCIHDSSGTDADSTENKSIRTLRDPRCPVEPAPDRCNRPPYWGVCEPS